MSKEKTDLERAFSGKYPWGDVIKVHEIGTYTIVEYKDRQDGNTYFHPYVAGDDPCWCLESLDIALIAAIAYANGESHGMIGAACRVLGLPK